MNASLGSRNNQPGPGLDAPTYRATDSRSIAQTLLLLAALGSSGCETYREMRAAFHPDEPQSPAGLRLLVEPAVGLQILIDGVEVAQTAPYEYLTLKPGRHRVEVRSAGYHSFAVPVQLDGDQLLELPLVLRKKSLPVAKSAETSPAPIEKPLAAVLEPPAPPGSAGPLLPPGVAPVLLVAQIEPNGALLLDGVAVSGNLRLVRTHGKLSAGALELRYRRGDAGLLFLVLPPDTATWMRDGRILAQGATITLNPGATRLVRRDADGHEQTLLLKR